MAGTPKMQEHFSASACMAERRKTKGSWFGNVSGMPKMQEQFSAGA